MERESSDTKRKLLKYIEDSLVKRYGPNWREAPPNDDLALIALLMGILKASIHAVTKDDKVLWDVLSHTVKHSRHWRDETDDYWFKRLVQEVGELGSSLAGDHKDPPEHELRQIASIAINWLGLREERTKKPTSN